MVYEVFILVEGLKKIWTESGAIHQAEWEDRQFFQIRNSSCGI
jgi:hypothetical protein